MPSRASAGMTSSLKSAYCSSISACAAGATAASSRRATPLPALRAASSKSAKRTSKNSSRFDETMRDVAQPLEQRHVVARAPAPARGG